MTTIQFDFATDTADGSYLGFFRVTDATPQSFSLFRNGTEWIVDMQLNRADYSVDGAPGTIRDGASIGYFQIKAPGESVQRFPVQNLLLRRASGSTKDRFRLRLGSPFIQG